MSKPSRRSGLRKNVDLQSGGGELGRVLTNAYAHVLGVPTGDASALHANVLEGFAFSALQRLQERVQLSADEIGAWLLIAPRTLARRKKEGRLHPEESDRLLRAARVFAATVELFDGDEAAARRWLSSACTGLGGARPIDVARTDVGTREVEALIGRLEHGVVV